MTVAPEKRDNLHRYMMQPRLYTALMSMMLACSCLDSALADVPQASLPQKRYGPVRLQM